MLAAVESQKLGSDPPLCTCLSDALSIGVAFKVKRRKVRWTFVEFGSPHNINVWLRSRMHITFNKRRVQPMFTH
jgi:hypothetical protein